jgi:RHS repeat-associated protein
MKRTPNPAPGKRTPARSSLGTVALLIVAACCLLTLALPSAAAAAECTDTWIGPAESKWDYNEYWSAGHAPTESDVACIGSGKTVRVDGFGISHAAVLLSEGTVRVFSGLELMNVGEPSIIASLTVSGTLSGPATIGITGSARFEGGTLTGSGLTAVLPGATVESLSVRAEGHDIVNEGTFTATEGAIHLSEGAEFLNTGTLVSNDESAVAFSGSAGGGEIVNVGTVSKTAGSGTSEIAAPIKNNGTVVSESGTLAFWEGGTGESGAWESSEGAQVRFARGAFGLSGGTLAGLVTITGPEVTVSSEGVEAEGAKLGINPGGTLNVKSDMSVDRLSMGNGALVTGPANLEIASSFNWKEESYMRGAGAVVILPEAVGSTNEMSVEGHARMEGRDIVNEGTFTAAHGIILLNEGSEIRNSGTFNVNEDLYRAMGMYGAGGKIVNTGIFQKTAGSGTTSIAPFFENFGEIHELSGHLNIENRIERPASERAGIECETIDPVNCANGDFLESQTDIANGGRGVGLDLTRSYSAKAAATGSPGIFGYGWTASFTDHLVSEESGARITLVSGEGSTVPFTKSGEAFKAPSWSQDTLSGSAETSFTLVLPSQVEYRFSSSGRLEAVTDRNGNETTLAYKEGRLETITDPAGRKITLTYSGGGQVESATDPMSHVVKYGYESGNLTSVTMPGEAEPRWRFKYDGSHRITQITDGRGGKTKNEYDGLSRVISQTDPAERTTTFEYAPFHTKITNVATGAVTDEWFTSNHEPFSITRGFGTEDATTETFAYNAAGRLLTKTDGLGHKTSYGYNANGDRTSEKDAAGDEAKWTFNETHDVVSMTTPEGEKTTIARDANGNPETVSRPAPGKETQITSFETGPHGELEALIDPLSHEWTYEYDGQGDRTAKVDPEGDKQTWEYDADSRAIKSVSPRGNEEGAEASEFTTSIERDPQGRPIKVTDPLGGTTEYEYDPNGNLEVETDANGHSTTFSYNAADELAKVERPIGDVEETGYDGAGEVTSQTDGNEGETTYVRNVLEQPIETIDPLERVSAAEFDAAGNLKSKTDPEERTTSYAYDAADRLQEISYSDGITPTATFGYDKDSNLTSMKDGTGESNFEFDQLDRLTHSEDGHGDTVGYEYNLGDEQIGLTYPNGKSISREFDNAGRLESLTDWLGHKTSFAYNNDSALKATTFPSGTGNVDEYGYDPAGNMSSVAIKKGAETLASLSYTRDKAGQLESLLSSGLPGAAEEEFSYDENERLTKAGSDSFEYDAANNLTEAPGTANSYDKASQLEAATGVSFGFDEEGERTKRTPSVGPATTYKYDQAGDLTAVERPKEGETPAITEAFAYDGTGLIASSASGGSPRYLVWDSSVELPLLLADGENSYLYGPAGNPVEQISSSEVPAYLHHDQLGSTRLLTNAAGGVSGSATYSAYGAQAGKSGSTDSPLGFNGQYTLGQSGLIYLRARFYDPGTAQLITRDPLEALTRRPYAYAENNPLTYSDPRGLSSIGEVIEEGPGFSIPCPVCAEANEALEEALKQGAKSAESLWNELGTQELDDGEVPEEPCPAEVGRERGNNEIGSKGEVRREEEIERDKMGHSQNANPGDPGWQPSGSRSKRAAALIAKIFSNFFHHP